MKRLITSADIKQLADKAEKNMRVEPSDIITPAAKDAAREFGINIVYGLAAVVEPANPAKQLPALDSALIAEIVREVLAGFKSIEARQQEKHIDACGLRLIKGDGVTLENFLYVDGLPKVKAKEVLSLRESPTMTAGFIELESTEYSVRPNYDEVNYIIDGKVSIEVCERKYPAQAGDVAFIPAGTQVVYSTGGKAKFLYITYPAANSTGK